MFLLLLTTYAVSEATTAHPSIAPSAALSALDAYLSQRDETIVKLQAQLMQAKDSARIFKRQKDAQARQVARLGRILEKTVKGNQAQKEFLIAHFEEILKGLAAQARALHAQHAVDVAKVEGFAATAPVDVARSLDAIKLMHAQLLAILTSSTDCLGTDIQAVLEAREAAREEEKKAAQKSKGKDSTAPKDFEYVGGDGESVDTLTDDSPSEDADDDDDKTLTQAVSAAALDGGAVTTSPPQTASPNVDVAPITAVAAQGDTTAVAVPAAVSPTIKEMRPAVDHATSAGTDVGSVSAEAAISGAGASPPADPLPTTGDGVEMGTVEPEAASEGPGAGQSASEPAVSPPSEENGAGSDADDEGDAGSTRSRQGASRGSGADQTGRQTANDETGIGGFWVRMKSFFGS